MKQIVAIPILKNRIAPCFEAAEQFKVFEVSDKKATPLKPIICEGSEGFSRIRAMRLHDIDILICGGIKEFYLNILSASNIEVYYNIQVTPWLSISPDFQYIINPGGTHEHRDAMIVGIRTQMSL